MGESCAHCSATPASLLRCAGCARAAYCGRACQKKGWKKHRGECRSYRVEEVAGKGLGMVAARRLAAGERVLVEAPLLVHTLDGSGSTVNQQFQGLPGDLQERVLKLHDENPEGPPEEKVKRIFLANAIEVAGAKCTALYPTIPRINHSCAPCAVWTSVEGQPMAKEVRTVREVQEGQEITANYIDSFEATFSPSSARQSSLRRWNFDCSCEVCGLPEVERERNDAKRKAVMLQHQLVPRYMAAWKVDLALAAARAKVNLMLELREEMETTLPSALLEVWEMARIGEEVGLHVTEDCPALLEEALALATRLGHGYVQTHREKVEQVASTLKEIIRRRRAETSNVFNNCFNTEQNLNQW